MRDVSKTTMIKATRGFTVRDGEASVGCKLKVVMNHLRGELATEGFRSGITCSRRMARVLLTGARSL